MKQEHFLFIGEEVVDWRIDERTRNRGLQGIAEARARLAACTEGSLADAA